MIFQQINSKQLNKFVNSGLSKYFCIFHISYMDCQQYSCNLIYILISSMENQPQYTQKALKFTYDQYIQRGRTLEGLIIDKYVVYNKIGEGSNGQVYKGMDDQTKKHIAIKLMNIRQINGERGAVRAIKQRLCESEPRLMYQCNSQNLIKCLDVFRNDDLKILILEYCNGSTLQKQIDEKRRIPEKEAIQIIKHLINGLMELHRHKIIHRDLKAENIMKHNGTYKIIDFGFSKKLQIAQENAEVKGTSLGTITTMAPEVMVKRPYGLKADIWSLGVIYFQMIYGVYPYDSLTAAALYEQIRTKKLFQNPKPPTINGFTPSQQSYDFIKFVIVFETSQRPSWKQLSEHPIFKKKNDEINQRFIQKVDVVVDPKLDELSQYEPTVGERSVAQIEDPKFQPKRFQPRQQAQINQPKRFEKEIQIKPTKKQEQKKEPEKVQVQQKPRFKINFSNDDKRRQQEMYERSRYEEYQKLRKQQQQKQAQLRFKKRQQQKPILNVTNGEKKQGQNFINVRQLRKDQVILKRKQENKEQQEEYQFTQRAHLECLKTQLIYKEIINPLCSTNYLQNDDRSTIQFFYLLLARCFNNMSPIQDEQEKRKKNKEMIRNLNDQITPLYNQVRSKFLDYSQRLTKTENKFTSIIGDFFKKNIDKSNFSEKDRFLTGIEVINYSKQEQINYTFRYYTLNIQKKLEGVSNLSNVVKRLNKYVQINSLTKQTLDIQGKEFNVAVKDIVG